MPATETAAQRFAGDEVHLAHELAIRAASTGGGHPVPQLDTAREHRHRGAFVPLLAEL